MNPTTTPPTRPGRVRRSRQMDISRRLSLGAAGAGMIVLLGACGAARATTAGNAVGSVSTTGSATTVAGATTPAAAAAAGASTTATGGNGNGNGAAIQAYRDCLSQHGVNLPARPTTVPDATTVAGQARVPGGGGGGLQSVIADPANKAAVDACQALMPAGGFGQGGSNPARVQARQAYNSCLSDNGVVVPTTVAGGPPPSIDQTSPAFAAANQKCQALLPQRGANASTTTTVAG